MVFSNKVTKKYILGGGKRVNNMVWDYLKTINQSNFDMVSGKMENVSNGLININNKKGGKALKYKTADFVF